MNYKISYIISFVVFVTFAKKIDNVCISDNIPYISCHLRTWELVLPFLIEFVFVTTGIQNNNDNKPVDQIKWIELEVLRINISYDLQHVLLYMVWYYENKDMSSWKEGEKSFPIVY